MMPRYLAPDSRPLSGYLQQEERLGTVLGWLGALLFIDNIYHGSHCTGFVTQPTSDELR